MPKILTFPLRVRSFWQDNRANTAIEFAILFPLFLFITLFLIELGLIGFSSISIENAVTLATRGAKLGNSTPAQVRADIQNYAYGLIHPEKLVITNQLTGTQTPAQIYPQEQCLNPDGSLSGTFCPCAAGVTWTDYNHDGVCTPGQAPLSVGQPGNVILYTVVYRWHLLTPIVPISKLFGSHAGLPLGDQYGDVLIVSGGAVRNEPN